MNISIGATSRGPGHVLRTLGSKDERGRISGRVLFRLLRFVQPHWVRMLVAALFMIASSGAGLLSLYLTKVAIDQNIASGDVHGLLITSLELAGALSVVYVASAAQTYILSWVGHRVLTTLRDQLFRHLQHLSIPYHDRHIVGITISRVTNDVEVINELLSQGLISMISDGILLVGTIVVMIAMEPRLALLAFSVLPLMILITAWFSRRARVAYRETRQRIGNVVGDLAENISGMRVIQAFAQEKTTQERFEEVNRANRDAYISAISLSFVFLPAADVLSMMAMGIVLWVGGTMIA